MTKPKSKTTAKSNSSGTTANTPDRPPLWGDRIDPRKKLLARVAGNIASSLVASPSPSITGSVTIATVAVDIAEQILRKAGVSAAAPEAAAVPGEAA